MNDRAVSLLEQYDIEVTRTRKGRGVILCDTDQGVYCFQEFMGKEKKLEIIHQLTEQAMNEGIPIQRILATKEGNMLVKDGDGIGYILKTYPEGREMNVADGREVQEAVTLLARLHRCMQRVTVENEESIPIFSVQSEYEKRNREMIRARKYLRCRGQKCNFERRLLETLDYYIEKGNEIAENYGMIAGQEEISFCHGDFQYHNLMYQGMQLQIVNCEKIVRDRQIRDLYFFLRKILEKRSWDISTGLALLQVYETENPISEKARQDLKLRLSYPEKYWKSVNFYMNTHKCWIPDKNLEKLEKILAQEENHERFVQAI